MFDACCSAQLGEGVTSHNSPISRERGGHLLFRRAQRLPESELLGYYYCIIIHLAVRQLSKELR